MGRGTVNVTPPAMAAPGGTATLDENGKIPVEQIPEIYSDEHIKDISPTSTSCTTLLAYIASRYADHPVIDGYVSGFSDLPEGVTGGQASIAMSGADVVVELHTADKVYRRTTTSTAAWTSEWVENYDSKNKPSASNLAGAVPIEGGGTGGTTAAEARANLDAAAASHGHDASDITGVIPVENGGTGAGSLAELATALGGVKYASGSYTGTGGFGSGNPMSLTFDFKPLLVYIINTTNRMIRAVYNTAWLTSSYISYGYDYSTKAAPISTTSQYARVVGNTLSWYSTNITAEQMNTSGVVYEWIAIGV